MKLDAKSAGKGKANPNELREEGREEEEGRGEQSVSFTTLHNLIVHTILPMDLIMKVTQGFQEIVTGPLQLTKVSHTDYLVG